MAELTSKRSPMSERALFWREFFILLGVSLFGVIAVLPYAITLQGGVLTEVPILSWFLRYIAPRDSCPLSNLIVK